MAVRAAQELLQQICYSADSQTQMSGAAPSLIPGKNSVSEPRPRPTCLHVKRIQYEHHFTWESSHTELTQCHDPAELATVAGAGFCRLLTMTMSTIQVQSNPTPTMVFALCFIRKCFGRKCYELKTNCLSSAGLFCNTQGHCIPVYREHSCCRSGGCPGGELERMSMQPVLPIVPEVDLWISAHPNTMASRSKSWSLSASVTAR